MGTTLFLHIGTPKTGTTTLQRFLVENQAALATRHDLWYPPPAAVAYGSGAHNSHVILPYSLLGRREWPAFVAPRERVSAEEAFTALQRDVDACEQSRMLVSSEDLSVHALFSKRLVERFRALRGCDIEVIVYLRPQDRILESLYTWSTDFWATGCTLEEIVRTAHPVVPRWLDYAEMLAPWRDAFGDDAIRCRCFGSTMPGGDIVTAMLTELGIEPRGFRPVERLNEARPAEVIEFFRLALPRIEPEARARFVADLRPHLGRDPAAPGHPGLSPESRAVVAERYRSTNRDVARAFFGRDELFPEPAVTSPPPDPAPLLTVRAAVDGVTDYWRERDRRDRARSGASGAIRRLKATLDLPERAWDLRHRLTARRLRRRT